MKAGLIAGLALMSAVPSGAGASDVPAAVAPDLSKLLGCRTLTDAPARLACFDREIGPIHDKMEQGQLIVVDKAQVREARRQRFGLAKPGLEMFAGADGQPLARVDSTVARAIADQYGKWIVTLADGSRWHQIDDYALAHAPLTGQPATVSRAAVGSFRMQIAHQALRVRRER